MTTVKQIKEDSITSFKSGNKEKTSTLRLLVAELEKEKVQKKLVDVNALTSDQVIDVINRQIKKLDKEIESYEAVNRSTESQKAEKEILLSYLPKQLSEDEIRSEIAHAVSLVEKGEIKNPMAYLSQKLKGKADMSLVSKMAREVK